MCKGARTDTFARGQRGQREDGKYAKGQKRNDESEDKVKDAVEVDGETAERCTEVGLKRRGKVWDE